MKSIKNDVSMIKSDVSTLKSNVGTLKSNVDVLNTEMLEAKKAQQLTDKRLSSIDSKQDIIYKQTGSLSEPQMKTPSLLEQVRLDVEFTYQKTAMNDLYINRIETHFIHKH
ncbi:hypothetical protein [Sporosarcina sp. P20a]|uniref:hypothetical protein n=1 Tax=Sporosarcina sp. P20a TaxID=2048256 RepID=UPI001304419C|nr:hypothetical protein [Sporosarcina sp. P20a]